MNLIDRKLNADVFDTGQRINGRIKKVASFQNGLNSIDIATGIIMPTDTTVIDETNGTSTKAITRGRGLFYLGDNSANSKKHLSEVRYPSGKGIGYKLNMNGKDIKSSAGDQVIFGDIGDTFEIESTITYKGIKNLILINDPVNAPDEYIFTLKEKGGANYTYEELNGGIICRDMDGDEHIYFKSPWVKDSSGDYGPAYLELGPTIGGLQSIVKRIDTTWLRQASGIVTFDPTVTIQDEDGGRISDSYLDDANVNDNYGGSTIMSLLNLSAVEWRSLCKVDLTEFSDLEIIDSNFQMETAYSTSNYGSSTYWKILKDWGEGSSSGASESGAVCWNYAKYNTNAWTTAGCNNTTSDRSPQLGTVGLNVSANTWLTLDISIATTQDWIDNPSGNHGIIILPLPQASSGQQGFFTSESSAGHGPKFYMEYTTNGAWPSNSYYGNREISTDMDIHAIKRARRIY